MAAALGFHAAAADGPDPVEKRGHVDSILAKLADPDEVPHRWLAKLEQLSLPPSEGTAVYIQLLADQRRSVRQRSLLSLRNYGVDANGATPAVLKAFADSRNSEAVRLSAIETLTAIAPDDPRVVDAFRHQLRSPGVSRQITLRIIESLGAARQSGTKALPELRRMLDQDDTETRYVAYCSIGKLRAIPPIPLARLQQVESPAPFFSDDGFAWFRSFQRHGPASGVTQVLIRLAEDGEAATHLRALALISLAAADRGDPRVVRLSMGKIADDDAFMAAAAKQHLATLSGQEEACIGALVEGLRGEHPEVRRHAALVLARFGAAAAPASTALCEALSQCDGATDQYLVAAYLDAIRALGPAGRDAGATIGPMLAENSKLYRDRSKWDVIRLRSYLFVVLSEIGVPPSATPYLIDALANFDDRQLHVELGAAARAAGSLGERGRPLTGLLAAALDCFFNEDEFSLERYDPVFPAEEATTVRMEVIRALTRIRPLDNPLLVEALQRIANEDSSADTQPRLAKLARQALQAIDEAEQDASSYSK